MCSHGKTHHTHQWTYIYKMKEKWRKTEKNKNYNKKLFRLLMQFFCFVLVVIWSKLPTSKIRLHLHISKKCIINHHFCFRFVSHKCNTNAIPNSVFVFFLVLFCKLKKSTNHVYICDPLRSGPDHVFCLTIWLHFNVWERYN